MTSSQSAGGGSGRSNSGPAAAGRRIPQLPDRAWMAPRTAAEAIADPVSDGVFLFGRWPASDDALADCLHIAMPTVNRRSGTVYIFDALRSIGAELQRGGHCGVINVFNMRPQSHVLSPGLADIVAGAGASTSGSDSGGIGAGLLVREVRVSTSVRATGDWWLTVGKSQQLADFFEMTRVLEPLCTTPWFMLMEDDFAWCEGLISAKMEEFRAYLARRRRDSTFRGLRIAAGLNGLLLRCADVPGMAETVFMGSKDLPVDNLLSTFWELSQRNITTYVTSTMRHLGDVSTVGNDKDKYVGTKDASGPVPGCGAVLSTHGSIPLNEWFNFDACCGLFYSPCSYNNALNREYVKTPATVPSLEGDIKYRIRVRKAVNVTSCDQACAASGMTCAPAYLPYVNKCTIMSKLFPCKSCSLGVGYEQPAYDHVTTETVYPDDDWVQ
jgi:hypothetical protein